MKKMKIRWRLYLNFFLLSLVLVTSFQNCSINSDTSKIKTTPLGLELITE